MGNAAGGVKPNFLIENFFKTKLSSRVAIGLNAKISVTFSAKLTCSLCQHTYFVTIVRT